MFIGMGMPIPDLSNLPGASRPGSGGGGEVIKSIDNAFSMSFDGVDDYVDTGSIDLGINGSISMWFKPSVGAVTDYVLIGEGSQGFDYVIRRQSGALNIWVGGTFYNFGLGTSIVDDEWNFLAVTKSAADINVYLNNSNGKFSNSRTEAGWTSASLKFDRIGARTISPINLPFNGGIDEVAGYNYFLTPELVEKIYNATSTGKTADLSTMATPPLAWYRMGD
jgi:hypothetical protein